MDYRREIDGLRAVAVLPVVFFHADFAWAAGGFVGVDVFFVISGFLITSIIQAQRAEGRFRFAEFYERRARRLLPVLFLVLAATTAAGLVLESPPRLADLGESLVATALFGSNFLFLAGTGYFDTATETTPLLHTWSLAVEEQYYLVFPGAFLLLAAMARRHLTAVLGVAAVASFALCLALVRLYPEQTFYFTPARIWELLAGAILALVLAGPAGVRVAALPGRLRSALGFAGLAAILGAIALLDAATPFPGPAALAPVLGTVAVLAFARADTVCGRLLARPEPVAIGLISYSLYLWHQPLLAFAKVHAPAGLPPGPAVALIAASSALAWASWRYVERPWRDRRRTPGRARVFAASAAGTLGAVAVGVALVAGDGLPGRFADHPRAGIIAFDPDEAQEETWASVRRLAEPQVEDAAATGAQLVVVGDSHAKDLANMLAFRRAALGDTLVLSAHVTNDACRGLAPGTEAGAGCVYGLERFLERSEDSAGVILAPSWRPGHLDALPRVLATLARRGVPVLLVSRTPDFPSVPEAVIPPLMRGRSLADAVSPLSEDPVLAPRRGAIDARLRAIADRLGVPLVDRAALVCPGGRCEFVDPSGRLLFYDTTHLTLAGAERFGARLVADPVFRAFLERLRSPRPGRATAPAGPTIDSLSQRKSG
ncbi:MAG: acyltransferase family protein [Azospirillaceae bacterium]